MPTPEETRSVKRVSVKIPLSFKIHPSMERDLTLAQREVSAYTSDMSIAGMGIISSIYVPEGVLLSIQLEGSLMYPERGKENNLLRLTGEVASSKMDSGQYRLGILLKEIPEQDKSALKKFIESTG